MGHRRSNDDEVHKISTSIYVTNFPDLFTAKDLWKVYNQYGTVIDSFISNRRSKSGKRFGFVRFNKIFDLERLDNNMCTIWVDRFKLHANIARFQRPVMNKSNDQLIIKRDKKAAPKVLNKDSEIQRNSYSYLNSYSYAVKKGNQPLTMEGENKPAIVFDETRVNEQDFSKSLMGKVKEFGFLSNLKVVLANEGFDNIKLKYMGGYWVLIEFESGTSKEKFRTNVGIGSWFSKIQQASNEFHNDARVTWVDIEGIPLKAKYSGYVLKRYLVGSLTLWKEGEEENDSDSDPKDDELDNDIADKQKYANVEGNNDVEEVSETIFENVQSQSHKMDDCNIGQNETQSENPFKIYDLLNKEKQNASGDISSNGSMKYPPGFTPTDDDKTTSEEIKIEIIELFNIKMCWGNFTFDYVYSPSVGNSGGILCVWDPRMFHKLNSMIYDYFAMIRGEWILKDKVILIISIYAPQDLSEKKSLWEYLTMVIDNWNGEVIIMGDFNEVHNQAERYGSNFNIQGANAFNSFISGERLEEVPLEKIREWVKAKKDSSNNYKKMLKADLAEIDIVLDKGEGDSDILNKRSTIFKALQDIDKLESMELAIRGILVDGTWIDSPTLVKKEFLSHFSNRFDQPQTSSIRLGSEFPNKLNLEQQMDLETNVTREEIKRAVWDCENFRFGDTWHGRIQSCLKSSRGSVMVNGSPTKEFQFHRGLKQGDPLSPFLFILIIESLHISVQRVVDAGMFKGISLGTSFQISHLFYADDVFFTGEWKEMSHVYLGFSLHRNPRVGIEQVQFTNLSSTLEDINIVDMRDRWVWSLEGTDDISVASVRRRIDDLRLQVVSSKTIWVNSVPIKINIHAWKVRNDGLPTRLNISKRGMDIVSISCPVCGLAVESVSHIFFACQFAREVFYKVCSWWDITFTELSCYKDWSIWLLNIRLHSKHKKLIEGVCYSMWWEI
nr:nucleotide-binding alpha-beta plait domain-containing protein [Tanacetum cinerariifolium]